MELTKEEMKKVIMWLEDYHMSEAHSSFMNLDDLPSIVNKFKTYLKGGES